MGIEFQYGDLGVLLKRHLVVITIIIPFIPAFKQMGSPIRVGFCSRFVLVEESCSFFVCFLGGVQTIVIVAI